jgi:hypothetical protein
LRRPPARRPRRTGSPPPRQCRRRTGRSPTSDRKPRACAGKKQAPHFRASSNERFAAEETCAKARTQRGPQAESLSLCLPHPSLSTMLAACALCKLDLLVTLHPTSQHRRCPIRVCGHAATGRSALPAGRPVPAHQELGQHAEDINDTYRVCECVNSVAGNSSKKNSSL